MRPKEFTMTVPPSNPSGERLSPGRGLETESVRAAVALAVRAPSIHNTQPWRWELRGGVLELRADRTRQLTVADPDGHSLLLSCGAAAALTALGFRAAGLSTEVTRMPDPSDPDLLATFSNPESADPTQRDLDEATAARQRHSERRPFRAAKITEQEIEQLRQAAEIAPAFAHFPIRSDENLNLAVAVSEADRYEQRDAAYLAEMARWTGSGSGQDDGVPPEVVPHVDPSAPRHTNVPLRDFEVGVPGSQLVDARTDEQPQLAVVFTLANSGLDQLIAGEAMMHLMIQAEMIGIASCPLSQAVDMMAFRARLRTLMSWTEYPQMMLRLGRPPAGDAAELTRRRPVDDVLRLR
jgi:nitroreductase